MRNYILLGILVIGIGSISGQSSSLLKPVKTVVKKKIENPNKTMYLDAVGDNDCDDSI